MYNNDKRNIRNTTEFRLKVWKGRIGLRLSFFRIFFFFLLLLKESRCFILENFRLRKHRVFEFQEKYLSIHGFISRETMVTRVSIGCHNWELCDIDLGRATKLSIPWPGLCFIGYNIGKFTTAPQSHSPLPTSFFISVISSLLSRARIR